MGSTYCNNTANVARIHVTSVAEGACSQNFWYKYWYFSCFRGHL